MQKAQIRKKECYKKNYKMDTADTASPYFIGPSYIGLSKSGAEYIDRVRLKHQTILTHFMPPYMI